ncbi:unnamed protein product [Dovyalis caffra]|uniref:Uncharacterized protein n=1 Tax=Dovyalis caffra TaxID=77055 RepID=A0AAV1RJN9_9ROSI|nr:unnamed protein product [Dovyalis caffra]
MMLSTLSYDDKRKKNLCDDHVEGLLKSMHPNSPATKESASSAQRPSIMIVDGEIDNTIANDVECINALVDGNMRIAQPGYEIGSRLHLSLVMSYGYVPEGDGRDLSVLISKYEMEDALSKLFSHQSYTMKGENPRNDVL